jgi:ATP-dependent Lon protease
MKESVQAALSYIRSKEEDLGLSSDFYHNMEIHVHVPAGAIPKDGPSAGITMVTALVSALTKIPVRKDVAMTGEITLRGKVLPIGGLKEKMLAAIRMGIKTLIIPEQNRKDLADIPRHILKKVEIVSAKEIEEVLKVALEKFPTVSGSPGKKTGGKVKAAVPSRAAISSRKGATAGARS